MKLRVVGWNVQPVVMADDGTDLTPLNVNVRMIPAREWEAFKAGGDEEALAALRAQVEGELTDEPDGHQTESA